MDDNTEISVLRTALRDATAERDALKVRAVTAENERHAAGSLLKATQEQLDQIRCFLSDVELDAVEGTNGGPVALAFRAAATILALRRARDQAVSTASAPPCVMRPCEQRDRLKAALLAIVVMAQPESDIERAAKAALGYEPVDNA